MIDLRLSKIENIQGKFRGDIRMGNYSGEMDELSTIFSINFGIAATLVGVVRVRARLHKPHKTTQNVHM